MDNFMMLILNAATPHLLVFLQSAIADEKKNIYTGIMHIYTQIPVSIIPV
jgi:hypothetical protein